MCLPYRRIEDVSDKLSRKEVGILRKMLNADIQSSVYLKNTSDEFVPDGYIETCNSIMRKLKLMDFGA